MQLSVYATVIQRVARGFTVKSQFKKKKAASIIIQSRGRRGIARAKLLCACAAVTSLSAWIRGVFAKAELIMLRKEKASTLIQTRYRILKAQKFC